MMQSQTSSLLREIECNTLPILELTREVEELDNGQADLHYDDIALLLSALKGNWSVRCAVLEGDFLDCLHPLRRSELLRALGGLRSLRHLGLGDSPILVSDLCHLVKYSSSLQSLRLHDSILQGTAEDFSALEEEIRGHPTLQELEFHECTSAIPGKDLKTLKNAGKQQRTSPTTTKPATIERRPSGMYGKHLPIAKRSDVQKRL
jgi:hypothetical protein